MDSVQSNGHGSGRSPDNHEKNDSPTLLTTSEVETSTDTSDDHTSNAEEESDDDDDEPALKYERIGGFVPDLFKKDSASALVVTSSKTLALGTHAGFVHMLDMAGTRTKSYKPHQASVVDIAVDETGEWIGTASMDGQVIIICLTAKESYHFDMKRPMKSIALEPGFAKKSTRGFVCGGLAGSLILREKGWLGHSDNTLHVGEGPIWSVRWRGRLIAWANDLGVKIYDTVSQTRITFIDRPVDSPRPDLFKCTLQWQDDSTLLISWADHIKVARIRTRPRTATNDLPPLLVEITAVFQLDCMIAGILPHPMQPPGSPFPDSNSAHSRTPSLTAGNTTATPSSLLILAYTPPDTSFLEEKTEDRAKQARKVAERPELRIISRSGEELAADALSVTKYQVWGCNDYILSEVPMDDAAGDGTKSYIVLSPNDIILVKPRDRRDHVSWLVERRRYEEALDELEAIEADGGSIEVGGDGLTAAQIGQRYIEHLVADGEFDKAAKLCPKVCGLAPKKWEHWIFLFAEQRQLQAIIPYVPTVHPRLDRLVYEMILAYFLAHDRHALINTIKEWPKDIYDIGAVIVAVRSELDKQTMSKTMSPSTSGLTTVLMECLAELYTANRQHGKALGYFLRLRRPNVIDLIREHNLFTDVQDQVLLLVEFDFELMRKRREVASPDTSNEKGRKEEKSDAIMLLVENVHSIPVQRVVPQLRPHPRYLFLYLDALFGKDQHAIAGFADEMLQLFSEYARGRLIDFLRSSMDYHLERAYGVCRDKDLVPEMVYLLGRMGNNKQALTLIIERLGDVRQAIEFAKEQADDDLWEDLLRYSESRPPFIRGLLENVGPEINPSRIIRRIKNGLEIPGLKEALIKILQDFQLQISLLDGCQTILNGDSGDLSKTLQGNQTSGFFLTLKGACPICTRPLHETPQALMMLFLCRHVVHARCCAGGDDLPAQPDPALRGVGILGTAARGLSGKIAFEFDVQRRIRKGCPVCHNKSEGNS